MAHDVLSQVVVEEFPIAGRFRPLSFRRRAPFGAGLLLCIALLAILAWSSSREERALLQMSADLRSRVYRGALANMKELCPPGVRPAGFDRRCRDQADFLAKFPECDAECRDLVLANRPQPTR